MANRTYFESVNKALIWKGQIPITDQTDFNNDNLSKTQQQFKFAFDICHRIFILACNKRFLQRKFTLDTTAVDKDYALDGTISVEGLVFGTVRNVTKGGSFNRRLPVRSYDWWREKYPNPEQYSRGAPEYLIYQPSDGNTPDRIIIWPYSDHVYTIEYQARLDVIELSTAAQTILCPTRYEHILWLWTGKFAESNFNEGRQMDLEREALEAFSDVLRDADGPYEDVHYIDLGMRLYDAADDWGPMRDYLSTDAK